MAEITRVFVCTLPEIALDDILQFDHMGRTFAIYRTEDDEVFATDGLCTHEDVPLADGLLDGCIIECPRHNGLFDIRTGEALRAPACEKLNTHEVTVEGGKVFLHLPAVG